MENKIQIAAIIRWIARIWGSVSLAIMIYMVGAHLLATITGRGEPIGHFKSVSEMVSFAFFPVCTMLGLGLSLKWEGIGGLITIGGIIGFHILRPDLFLDLIIDGLAAPGLLFLIYWILSRDKRRTRETNSSQ